LETNKLIDKRVVEHEQVINLLLIDIEKIRKTVSELKQDPTKKMEITLEAQKLMSLKDRMMFHKAAVLVLKDLQEELNGRKEK
jgi:hypothetical protein